MILLNFQTIKIRILLYGPFSGDLVAGIIIGLMTNIEVNYKGYADYIIKIIYGEYDEIFYTAKSGPDALLMYLMFMDIPRNELNEYNVTTGYY